MENATKSFYIGPDKPCEQFEEAVVGVVRMSRVLRGGGGPRRGPRGRPRVVEAQCSQLREVDTLHLTHQPLLGRAPPQVGALGDLHPLSVRLHAPLHSEWAAEADAALLCRPHSPGDSRWPKLLQRRKDTAHVRGTCSQCLKTKNQSLNLKRKSKNVNTYLF